jgi:hypothetical protein
MRRVKGLSLVRAIMRIERTISARFPGRRGLVVAGFRVLLLSGVTLLVACGYFGSSRHPAVAHQPRKTHAPGAVDPATRALQGMVEAVGPAGAQPPIELRFSIRDRPQVGQRDEIDYALVPQEGGLESIRLIFGSGEGLRVVSHGPTLAAIKPAGGVPIFGSVTVQPLKAGLFTLTAAVAVQSGAPSSVVVWPFTIPVIAGEGPAQTAANEP